MKTSAQWMFVFISLAMSWCSTGTSVAQDDLQQRIQSKAQEAQKLAQELTAQGQPPVKQVAKMKTVPQLIKRRDFKAVEERLDEILDELRSMAEKNPSMAVEVKPRIETTVIDCASDPRCTEIFIVGDLHARQEDGTSPFFRGYADPDLAYDPATKKVWLAYSWLHFNSAGGGVQSHVAELKGDEFHYVRTANRNEKALSPKGTAGWLNHEVASLAKRPDGQWELLWLTYHKGPAMNAYEGGAFVNRSVASKPAVLGDDVEGWLFTKGTSEKYQPIRHNINSIPSLSDCQMVTEPAHLVYDGDVYLGVNCVCFGPSGRMPQKERFVLLRETANGYEHVSTVLTHGDAQSLAGADRIEQVDLYEQRDGTIGLMGTPMKDQDGKSLHMGCYFMEFDDFKKGTLKRDSQGRPLVKFVLKDSESQPRGQGACTYDKNYDGGILLIRRIMPPASKEGVIFSLIKTSIHP